MAKKSLRSALEETEALGEELVPVAPKVSPKVRIIRVKEFVARSLPEASTLRRVLLEENDEMEGWEFVAKVDIWLRLLRMEFS